MLCNEGVSVQKKDEKSAPPSPSRPPALKTVVGVPHLPVAPSLKENVEELSGSVLLEEIPPRAEPATLRPAAASPQSEPAWATPIGSKLPMIALAGIAAGVGLILLVLAVFRPHRAPRSSTPVSKESTSALSSRTSSAIPSSSSATAAAVTACTLAGDNHVVAPNATVAAGIEARSFGQDVALGFAPNEHQATLVRLDPTSLSPSDSTTSHTAYAIHHVTPIPGRGGRLGLAVDVDQPGDSLLGRRSLPVDPPLQIGALADGGLAWAPLHRGVQGRLWPSDGQAPADVEALRGARSESNLSSVAVAFRRAAAIWVGAAEWTNTLVPRGKLWRIAGLGTSVGSPAIAIDEGIVFVAWADRPTSEGRWQLRLTRFKAGEAPEEPKTFTPPPGGKGQDTMSPSIAVLPDQRFLLVWTEGSANDHDVRALTFSTEGAPIGAPLNISNAGVDAGQGQAAVTSSGRGVVAFLESYAGGFRVAATPIACSP
jgi:hypothetical protein